MNVNPGELKERIQILEEEITEDSDGYYQPHYKVFHSCRAKVSQKTGTEHLKNNADFSDVSVRFLIRHTRKRLTRRMVVRYQETDFEIQYLNDYQGREYIEIIARRLTQDDR